MKRRGEEYDEDSNKKLKQEFFTEEDFEDEYNDELYIDDEEKERLSKVSELEREQILAQRFDHREELQRQKEKAIKEGKFKSSEDFKKRGTKQSKQITEKTALSDIKAKRAAKKQNILPIPQETEEIQKIEISKTRKIEQEKQIEKPLEYSSLKSIVLTRNELLSILYEPFFEEITKGCFVRISLGENQEKKVYRLCQIDGFKEKGSYTIDSPTGPKTTNKLLILRYADYSKSFSISLVSNHPVTLTEFQKWFEDMVKLKQKIPTNEEVLEKKKSYNKTKQEYVYGEDQIKEILAKKGGKNVNLAEKKMDLLQKKEIAIEESKLDEVEEIEKEIEEVEKLIQAKNTKEKKKPKIEVPKQGPSLLNSILLSSDIILEEEEKDEKGKKDSFDPFARRPTRSVGLFVTTDVKIEIYST